MTYFESLLALMLAAVVMLQLARRFSLPYPTVMAAAGVAVASIPGAPVLSIEPATALALFIAPVLVDAAFDFPLGAARRLALPLIGYAVVAVLATAAIFSFIWTWDDFFGPLIYLNDIDTYTVQLGLRSFVDSTGASDWSALFAMSNLSLVPVFLFFLFFQRLLIEGIATTGMKR